MASRGQAENEDQNVRHDATETTLSTAELMKNKTVEIVRGATDKIDEKRKPIADAVESAATKVYVNAGGLPGGEKVANVAIKAADGLQDTADYVRQHDARAALNDVLRFFENHPAESLAVAAGIGFLLARAFSRSEY